MSGNKNTSALHIDGVPPIKESVPLGLQHLLAMVVSNMVPAILLANILDLSQDMATLLIQGSMLSAGIGTLLQLYPIPLFRGYSIGSKLPVVMGVGFVYLGASLSVAGEYGLATLFGSQIIAAIISIFFGVIVKKMRDIFTPVISGIIVTCMGIGLYPTAMKSFFGGEGSPGYGQPVNVLIGTIVALIIILLQKYGKKLIKDLAVLIGIFSGYIISLVFGLIDFSSLASQSWFALPKPLAFGLDFKLEVIVVFTILFGVAIADIMGGFTVVTSGGMDREVTDEELSSGVIGAGVGSIISAVFNTPPINIYGGNAAIVAMNKVVSRAVFAVTSIMLIIAGLSPKISAIMTTIPDPVIGGATLIVFASIAISGMGMLSGDLSDEDKVIAGVSIAFSIGLSAMPGALDYFPPIVQTLLGSSTVVSGAFIAFILTIVLKLGKKQ